MALALFVALRLSVQTAWAAETEISINAPAGTIQAGDSFTVTVDLSGNPGFCAVQFTLAFDQDTLTCTDASTGNLLQGMLSASNPEADTGAIIAAASVDPVQKDGTLGTFRFTAKEDLSNPSFRLEEVLLADEEGEEFSYTIQQQNGEATAGAQKPTDSQQIPVPQAPEGNNQEQTSKPEQPVQQAPQESANQGETSREPAQAPSDQSEISRTHPQEIVTTVDTPKKTAEAMVQFTDVNGHWAEEYIRSAAAKGLVSGYSDGSFRPGGQVTRGQMAVILWRMAGRPQSEGEAPFTDLTGVSDEFRTAIAWGYGKGLLNGVSATAYAPGEGLSRQAAMKLLHGYFGGVSGMETMLTEIYDATFSDSGQLSSWAKEPVYWAVYNGILTGTSQSTLSPRSGVTRAQLSAILLRALERFDT